MKTKDKNNTETNTKDEERTITKEYALSNAVVIFPKENKHIGKNIFEEEQVDKTVLRRTA